MESLKERIRKRTKEFKETIKTEKLIDPYIRELQNLGEVIGLIYPDSVYLSIYNQDVEEVELKLTQLSSALNVKWDKIVSKNEVIYNAVKYINKSESSKITIFITIHCSKLNSCKIISVPTGRKKYVEKTIVEEVLEYKYLIDCGNKDGNGGSTNG